MSNCSGVQIKGSAVSHRSAIHEEIKRLVTKVRRKQSEKIL